MIQSASEYYLYRFGLNPFIIIEELDRLIVNIVKINSVMAFDDIWANFSRKKKPSKITYTSAKLDCYRVDEMVKFIVRMVKKIT